MKGGLTNDVGVVLWPFWVIFNLNARMEGIEKQINDFYSEW